MTVADIFERLVRAYLFAKAKGPTDAAEKLLAACLDVCDHLLDQGYAEGNNNISCSGFPIKCVLAIRKELAESGRLRDMLLAGAACTLQIHGDALMHEDWSRVGYYPRNTDLSPDYLTLLVLTSLLPDDAERLQRLYAYSRAVSCLCDPDLGEPYAWDGTGHHHGMYHTAYTGGVFTRHAYALRGTPFRLSPAAMAILKRSTLAYAFLGGPGNTVPPNIPGYTGQPLGIWVPFIARMMTQCDTAENRHGVDPDIAAIYLAMPGCNGPDDVLAQKCRTQAVEPHRFIGHLTLNGASIALHRRDNWLVSIAGQNRFRRGYEANGAYIASAFNHYSRNGSVFVVSTGDPPSPWQSGFSLEGWDSRHQPGRNRLPGRE